LPGQRIAAQHQNQKVFSVLFLHKEKNILIFMKKKKQKDFYFWFGPAAGERAQVRQSRIFRNFEKFLAGFSRRKPARPHRRAWRRRQPQAAWTSERTRRGIAVSARSSTGKTMG
jgi:hypothetical protein